MIPEELSGRLELSRFVEVWLAASDSDLVFLLCHRRNSAKRDKKSNHLFFLSHVRVSHGQGRKGRAAYKPDFSPP
jgi:hypothetical protein